MTGEIEHLVGEAPLVVVPSDELDIDIISNDMLNAILLKEGIAEVATYKPNVKYADYFAAIEAGLEDDFAVDR